MSAKKDDHIPVLLKEAVHYLKIVPGSKYIDATIGLGGHARQIVKEGGELLGIDRDKETIKKLKAPEDGKILTCGNFKNIDIIAKKHNFYNPAGILFDLGLSSWQIEKSKRGFSYRLNENLDMRYNLQTKIKASDILNKASKEELYEIFSKYGEEQHSRSIAESVVHARPIKKTGHLRKIIEKTIKKSQKDNLAVTARVFQALRIAVNDELESIKEGVDKAFALLRKKGRLVVISFHSLEDRIIKLQFRKWKEQKKGLLITKKPVRPQEKAIMKNPRARSARLRVIEKI